MLSITLIGIAIGLSMDAFAISITNAVSIRDFSGKHSIVQALYFGFFQMLMPFIGWSLGSRTSSYVEAVGHWIAFVLLSIIGINMIVSSLSHNPDATPLRLTHKTLFFQAIATSIDALAVGVGFGILHLSIFQSCLWIGCITFLLSLVGSKIGLYFGGIFKEKATLFGGIILILIGLQILLEHTVFS